MNRDKIYTIRFNENEWEGIANRAKLKDMRISDYLRSMIDKGEIADHKDKSSNSTDFDW
jgi:hypothetical protein